MTAYRTETEVKDEVQPEPSDRASFSNTTENQEAEQEEMSETTFPVTDTNVNQQMPMYVPAQAILQRNEFPPEQVVAEPCRPVTYIYQTIPNTNQQTTTGTWYPVMNPIPVPQLNPNACPYRPINTVNQQLSTQSECSKAKIIYKCPQPEIYISRCPNCQFSALKVQIFMCDVCSFCPPVTQQCSCCRPPPSAISIPLSFVHIDENNRRSDSGHGHSTERNELHQTRNSNFHHLCQDPSHRLTNMSSIPTAFTAPNNSVMSHNQVAYVNTPQTPLNDPRSNHGWSCNRVHSNAVNNPIYMQVPSETPCMVHVPLERN